MKEGGLNNSFQDKVLIFEVILAILIGPVWSIRNAMHTGLHWDFLAYLFLAPVLVYPISLAIGHVIALPQWLFWRRTYRSLAGIIACLLMFAVLFTDMDSPSSQASSNRNIPTPTSAPTPLYITEGMKATLLRKEPCFKMSWAPSSYWEAVRKKDTETLQSFDNDNTVDSQYDLAPSLRWLQPGQHVRFLDGGGFASTPRLQIEDGAGKDSDCYVRDNPPSEIYQINS